MILKWAKSKEKLFLKGVYVKKMDRGPSFILAADTHGMIYLNIVLNI